MRKLTSVLTLCVCAAAFAVAQPQQRMGSGTPPTPTEIAQRRVSFLTQQLSLTDVQVQQATTIFSNAATAEAAVRDNMKTAHEALTAAIKKNDAAGIEQASTTIGTLTAQSTSTDAKANAAFYQILTADQQASFQPGGFGMGMGGGMGGRMGTQGTRPRR